MRAEAFSEHAYHLSLASNHPNGIMLLPQGRRRALENKTMWYVYLLRSKSSSRQTYVGLTQTLKERIKEHNSGKSIHTNKFKPWTLVTYMAFSTKPKADRFERYLKTGSGRAFAKRRLW